MNINQEPKREPQAHIKSLEFDSKRKILVVEGKTDRLFLEYLSLGKIDLNTIILEIESVKIIDEIEGGNRGKIIHFASLTKKEEERLKFLVDRDYSKYTNDVLPKNLILTDFKDLESYLYENDFLEKFLRVGLKTEKINAIEFLNELEKVKYFGFVRITSLEKKLNLSVCNTNEKLSKYVDIDNSYKLSINEDKYLESLLQNSKYSIKKDDLKKSIQEIIRKYSIENSRFIIHGKDAISVIAEICQKLGYKKENIESIFWMSFDSNKVNLYPNLKKTIDFINC